MKKTNLTIAIASSLAILLAGNVFAENNTMDVSQTRSAGTVDLTQGVTGPTANSTITVIQNDVDNGSTISVEQKDANGVEVNIQQYDGEGSTITIEQSGGTTDDSPDSTNVVNINQGGSGGMNIGNSFTVNTQTGSGNKIVEYQGSPPSSATQGGAINNAELIQNGNESIIGFRQDGISNAALVIQETNSYANRLDVSQLGSDSTMLTVQTENTSNSAVDTATDGDNNNVFVIQGGIMEGVDNSTIAVNITGNNNNLDDANHSVIQLSSDSDMSITITGNDNKANLFQNENSTGSSMALTQGGDSNTAEMQQLGAVNSMSLTQTRSGALLNTATLIQTGILDTMTVSQIDGGTATLTQN